MWEFIQFKYIEQEADGIYLIFRGMGQDGERNGYSVNSPDYPDAEYLFLKAPLREC